MNRERQIDCLAELRREIARLRGEDPETAVVLLHLQMRAERFPDSMLLKPQAE